MSENNTNLADTTAGDADIRTYKWRLLSAWSN